MLRVWLLKIVGVRTLPLGFRGSVWVGFTGVHAAQGLSQDSRAHVAIIEVYTETLK